jgi:hypothetical protein
MRASHESFYVDLDPFAKNNDETYVSEEKV